MPIKSTKTHEIGIIGTPQKQNMFLYFFGELLYKIEGLDYCNREITK